jgi:hypothetical protein
MRWFGRYAGEDHKTPKHSFSIGSGVIHNPEARTERGKRRRKARAFKSLSNSGSK